MQKHPVEHEEEGGEAWLLPYSDLMTLLLAVFIVLFAVSQQDTAKMEKMSSAFKAIFESGGSSGILDGEASIIDDAFKDAETPESVLPDVDPSLGSGEITQQQQMEALDNAFKTYILENNLSDSIKTSLLGDQITITLASDILFPLGSAELADEQKERAHVIAGIIAKVANDGFPIIVKVSGHTDNLPIKTSKYPSNLSLGLDRAMNFMLAMVEDSTMDPRSFTIAGCGDLEPVDTNDTEEGRKNNRRVEINLSCHSTEEE